MKESLGRLVAILHRRNIAYLNTVLKPYQITSGEVGIMRSLYQREDRSQEELSLTLSIDKAAIARAVKSLEGKGYVRRINDERDKRCNRLFLTDKAKRLQGEIEPLVDAWNDESRSVIGDEEYAHLSATLHTLLQRIEEGTN
ncbi:MAG TPA: MarR family transcriptional regulator [Sphaerochaeta sp.]|jgi:DNA-binding MarR family transcriptional regulator|nr:MarR family transcriptional regulator [Sphaerochaeta sp.]